MPSVEQVKGHTREGRPPGGHPVRCGACQKRDRLVVAPLLGWLVHRPEGGGWCFLPRVKRAAAGETYLWNRTDAHRPADVRCTGCGRQQTINPRTLGRGRDPREAGAAVYVPPLPSSASQT